MWRRVVGSLWVAACATVVIGQWPFAVVTGGEAAGAPVPTYKTAGTVPGLTSQPLGDVPEGPTGDTGGEAPRVHEPDEDARTGDEVVDARSVFSRSFERSDGLVETRLYSEPVAYPSGGGFGLIDTSVVGVAGEPGALESKANAFGVEFRSTGQGVTVVLPSGKEVVSRPLAFDGDAPAVVVSPVVDPDDDSVVWYRQVWPGVDLRYAVMATGVREDVVYTGAPEGSSAVTFAVSGAELDPVWEVPAPASTADSATPPERVEVPAPSAELDAGAALLDVSAASAAVGDASREVAADGREERLDGLREAPVDRPADPGARSSVAARGAVAEELDFGHLVVASGEEEEMVLDQLARPLARSRVTAPGESLVEYSVDDAWIDGLAADGFPVVLDPDLSVFSNGWRVYFNVANTECGSGGSWCWPTVGYPAWPGYPYSTFRTVMGFDISAQGNAYGLWGAGSSAVLSATLRFNKEGGVDGNTAMELFEPSAWSWDGAAGGAYLWSSPGLTDRWGVGDHAAFAVS